MAFINARPNLFGDIMKLLRYLIIIILIILALKFIITDQNSINDYKRYSKKYPDREEIQKHLASLKGNSISDCLARQLGKPITGIDHSTEPCPVRELQHGQWTRIHFFGVDRIPIPFVQFGEVSTLRTAQSTLVIYLIGGPLQHINDNLLTLPILQDLPKETAWIVPIYRGMGLRATDDGGVDLRHAFAEVSALLKHLRKKYPKTIIDVIGESHGSLLATRIEQSDYDRLILLSPPLSINGSEYSSYFNSSTSQEKRNFDTVFVDSDNIAYQIPVKVFPYLASAGSALGDNPVVPQEGIRADCSLLVYGKRDGMFAPEWVRGQRLFDRFTQVVALDAGHEIMSDPANKARTLQAIREFRCPD